ncbi:unnamed protein product [Urochloa humidicola]
MAPPLLLSPPPMTRCGRRRDDGEGKLREMARRRLWRAVTAARRRRAVGDGPGDGYDKLREAATTATAGRHGYDGMLGQRWAIVPARHEN